MRVCSYNIWAGGDDRLGAVADVVRHVAPDAVAVLELRGEQTAAELAGALAMQHVFGEGNGDWHVAWLSRHPIRRVVNHRLPVLAKTLLEIDIGLRLFATHLASRHELPKTPAHELRAVADLLGQVRSPHVLVGDFNALRAEDRVGTPPPNVEPRGEAAGAPRRAFAPLLDGGYVDCYRALHPADPGYTYTAQVPWLRLDYVFASPSLAASLTACDVEDRPPARNASDHLAVWAEFTPRVPVPSNA